MDGDRYHLALAQRYQKLYKQVGQAHFFPEELAHDALKPLMKDAKQYGDGVIALLGQAANPIEESLALPTLRQMVDRDDLKQTIEQWTQELDASPRAKDLALNVCERYIDNVDLSMAVVDVRHALIAHYLRDIYIANFESPAMTAPGTSKYDIPHDMVLRQLPQMREHIEDYVAQIARSVARKLSFDHIHLPAAPRANEPVGLDEVLVGL